MHIFLYIVGYTICSVGVKYQNKSSCEHHILTLGVHIMVPVKILHPESFPQQTDVWGRSSHTMPPHPTHTTAQTC